MDRAGSGGAGDRRGLDEEHCPAGGAPGEPDPDPTAERSLGSAERERRAEDLVRRGLLCLDYDPTAALRMAERALESDPANTNARLLLGRACRMRDEQALRETLARRADDLYADGRLEEAIQTWERLLVLDPPDRRELDIRIRTSRTLAARVAARGEHAGAAAPQPAPETDPLDAPEQPGAAGRIESPAAGSGEMAAGRRRSPVIGIGLLVLLFVLVILGLILGYLFILNEASPPRNESPPGGQATTGGFDTPGSAFLYCPQRTGWSGRSGSSGGSGA